LLIVLYCVVLHNAVLPPCGKIKIIKTEFYQIFRVIKHIGEIIKLTFVL